ncbi:hypothetical protein Nisw_04640 [Candidatus Nitrosopumilus sp. SW]|uniref:hypothetical protein n=1 Tax=Candidatus Nitrosopumilus sp. SW TaxID=2508726 RepID=UPI00114E1BD0|nr:hypothetical protein [Candidatus Nitrosopumilus sp. SW]QDI88856.1 hypothetical protein Nisw_04640 [Candidatus Nitrosopumilus sp. SW]
MSFEFEELDTSESNSTATGIIVTNATSIEPEITSLELNGQDDFIQIENATVTDDVDGLTVTAWVKPDYSSGSSEFTVVSKDKSFSLTISNNFLSDNTAKFSVFDGIKWTTVESTSVITENWNFLSSTFDGDNIGIFVNGTREATQKVVGVPTLTTNGKLETTTVENLTSEEDIVIGATVTVKKEVSKASNQFSGEIDDVSLYDYVLEDEQILAMYEQTKAAYAKIVPELSLEEILAQIEAEQLANSENSTSTAIQSNSTSVEIISAEPTGELIPEPTPISEPEIISTPILDSTEQTFELSEDATFELEFFDEYDALLSEIEEIESAAQILLTETESSLTELNDPALSTQSFAAVLGMIFSIELFLPSVDAANGNDVEQTKTELESLKQQLESLKIQTASLKQSGNLDEESVKDLKKQLKSILNDIKSTANKLNANDKAQAVKLDKSSHNAKKIVDVDTFDKKQNGKWQDDETEINTEVFDSKGNKVDIKSEIQKNRDGKFTITLLPDDITTPGLYKLKTTFTVNGETHTVEEEFAWGLVSLNTAKSTYYPGDDAEFTIVVLDSEGHPIGGADILMTVTSPNGEITELETGDEITSGKEIGLYEATYPTGIEGTYQISVNAKAYQIHTNFNTTFDVASFVEYDIIRTAQSKIDPITDPNSFNVKIDIESFTDKDTITITETVPSVFEISDTDANIITVGDRKVLTWNKDLINDRTTLEYTYSVPLVFPQLYPLGPLEISDGDIVFVEARPWYVANDPVTGFLASQVGIATGTVTSATTANSFTISADTINPAVIIFVAADPSTVTISSVDIVTDGTSNSLATPTLVTGTLTSDSQSNAVSGFYTATLEQNNIPIGQAFDVQVTTTAASDISVGAIVLSGVQQDNTALSDAANTVGAIVADAGDDGSMAILVDAGDAMISGMVANKNPTTPLGGTSWMDQVGTDFYDAQYSVNQGDVTVTHSWTLPGGTKTLEKAIEVNYASQVFKYLSDSITVSDTIANTASQTIQLSDSITVSDTIANTTSQTIQLSDSITVSDTIANTASQTIQLSDSITVSDDLTNTATQTIQLSDSITVSDTITNTATQTIQLSDSITVSDTIANTATQTIQLSDSITITDTLVTAATFVQSLSDSITVSDTVTETVSQTQPLSDSVGVTDTLVTAATFVQSLSDSITVSDTIANTATQTIQLSDSITITDTFATEASITKTLSDSITVSDTVTETVSQTQPLSDSVGVTDTLVTAATFVQSLSDSITVSDTIANTATQTIQLSDSITITDTLVTAATFVQSLSDSITVSDTVTETVSQTQPLSDSVGVTDTLVTAATFVQSLSDSITVSDTIANTASQTIQLSDSITITDTFATEASITKTLSDSITVSDTVTETVSQTQPLSDSVGVTDTLVTAATFVQSLSDSITVSDTIANTASQTIQLSDSVGVTDTLVTAATFVQSLSDSITVSDTVTETVSQTQPLSDSVGVTDTLVTAATFVQSLSDSITVSDTIANTASQTIQLSDSVGVTDTLVTAATFVQSLSDSITVSDTVTETVSQTQPLSDSVGVTDTLVTAATFVQSLSDSITVSDTIANTASQTIQLSDSITITDTFATEASITKTLSDSITVSDTVTETVSQTQPLSDSVGVTDTLVTAATFVQSLSDSITVSDTIANTASQTIQLSDSITITDTFATEASITKTFSDSITVSDTVATNSFQTIQLSDSITITDTFATEASITKTFSDSITVSDTIANTASQTIQLSDSITITDTLVTAATFVQSLSDSITVSDTVATNSFQTQPLSDSVGVTDTLVTAATFVQSLSDSITVSDTIANTASQTIQLSDSITITDTFATEASITKTFSDSITVSDTVATNSFQTIQLSDSITITDTFATEASITKTFSDSITVSDTIANTATQTIQLSDSITITDTLVTAATFVQSLSDSITVSDTVATNSFQTQPLSDSVGVTDTLVTAATFVQSLSDSITVSDTIANTASQTIQLSDSITITDTFATEASITKTFSDSITVSDTVATNSFQTIQLSDSITITDTFATEASITKTFSDSITVSDTIANTASQTIQLSDSITITDTLVTAATFVQSLSDSITISDTIANTASQTIQLSDSITLSAPFTKIFSQTLMLSDSISVIDAVNAKITMAIESAEVITQNTIKVTFSQDLSASTVSTSDFTITSPSGITVTSVSVNDNVVTLTVSPALGASISPTLNLVGTVTSTDGVDAETQSGIAVSSDTTVVPPKVLIISTNNAPYTVSGTSEPGSSITVREGINSIGTGTADSSGNWSVTITTLSDGTYSFTATQTDTSNNTSGNSPATSVTISSSSGTTFITTTTDTETVNVTKENTKVIMQSTTNVTSITIASDVQESITFDFSAGLTTTGSKSSTTITTSGSENLIINFNVPHDQVENNNSQASLGNIRLSNGTVATGSAGVFKGNFDWGDTEISIPDEISGRTTTSYSEIAAFEIGLSTESISLSKPARIEFTNDAGFIPVFVNSAGTLTFITETCTSDSAAGLGSNNECKIDVGGDLVVWTNHFTKFGASKSSSSTSPSEGKSGGGGNVGVGPSGRGLGGFGGILGTPLTINEVSYDKCDENIAKILVSSDAEKPPVVTIHTTKTGTVIAVLSDEQPYEELNKITRVDKYLYEIPITSNETFLMVTVTEEKGTVQNTVNAAINTPSCDGVVVISDIPEGETGEISFGVPRIFDVKFQIENGTQHIADVDSEYFYVSEQDLNISAIIDSKTPLKRVELRTITLGQSDDEYIAMKMNVEPLIYTDSAYQVSASIPSFLLQDPAVSYWIHVIDEELSEVESKHYTMGVKPITEPDVSLELDVPSIQASNSIVRPNIYIENEQAPAYGIVSLLVDGEVVSKQAQFFDNGQTKVSFDWKTPFNDGLSSYDIQAKVDLYGISKVTDSGVLYNYPKTVSMSAYDMKTIQPIKIDGKVLSEPVLIYASDSQDEFKFNVIAPNGQCIIGASDECSIQDSTRQNRGGLQSVEYDGQILRVKYSGADSALERFSITSIDPIVGDWTVTLETEQGLIPEAQAIKDLTVKVKQKILSEMITIYSD